MTDKTYAIRYKKSVDKDLRKLPNDVRKILIDKIQSLSLSPIPAQSTKLRGSTDLYRLRFTSYRIIYQIIGKELVILIIKVGHRKDVYRDL